MSIFIKGTTVLTLAAMTAVSGCSNAELYGASSFATPETDGYIDGLNNQFSTGGSTKEYAVVLGIRNGSRFAAYSGLDRDADVVANMTGGEVSYSTAVTIYSYEDISRLGDSVYADPTRYSGTMTVTADFDDGSLSGNSGTINGTSYSGLGGYGRSVTATLTIDGSIAGETVTGTVVFNPSQGTSDVGALRGLAGDDQVIGVFHGSEDDFVYAGGFEGLAN